MKKYKISELAKDLKVASKELIETLKKYFRKPPKTTTNLSDEEANIALELYSQKNQVESFDLYFKSGGRINNIEKENSLKEQSKKNSLTEKSEVEKLDFVKEAEYKNNEQKEETKKPQKNF